MLIYLTHSVVPLCGRPTSVNNYVNPNSSLTIISMYKNKNEIYIQRRQVYDLTLLDYALKSLYAIYMLFTKPPLNFDGRVGHGEK
jgi:hypothetical protein